MTAKTKILWIDDEISFFKGQILFLQKNNFEVITATNAQDALDILKTELVDLILLDEIMPGLRGLDALMEIKKIRPHIPIVMITKSEEEDVMNEAIGKNISGYLVKPVSNAQLLSTIKQHIQKPKLFEEQTRKEYFEAFRQLSQKINFANTSEEWIEIYKEITYWDIQAQSAGSREMMQFIEEQKENANIAFSNFIEENYIDWISDDELRPLMSQTLLKEKLFPYLKSDDQPIALILIDNFRYDHWLTVSPIISKYFKIKEEALFYSILPTTTQYSRNAIFSGLMPAEIKKLYPNYWYDDEEDEHKNLYEKELLEMNLQRHGIKADFFFRKIFNNSFAEKVNK
jgi:DNA-binding response OmpR family regulator